MRCHEFYQRRSKPCAKCAVSAVFSSGTPCVLEGERLARLPNGLPRWGEIRTFPVYDERRHVRFVVTIGFDVTERKYGLERQQRYVDVLKTKLRQTVQPVHDRPGETPQFGLTDREMEVLALMAEGFTNREISEILSISPHTVKSHVIHIFNRLGVNDRTEAATLATRFHLI
jgi:DNA-binding CsgD family transcriptional regulator